MKLYYNLTKNKCQYTNGCIFGVKIILKIYSTKVLILKFGCIKKGPEGFRLPGFYQVAKSLMSRFLVVGGISGFDIECGIVSVKGVGNVVYRNSKGTGGFYPGRGKGNGSAGSGGI